MKLSCNHINRVRRVSKWFASARLGLFYHWGFFNGGGMTSNPNDFPNTPLKYPTGEAFDNAMPPPETVARNLVRNALYFGAKYIHLTAFHANSGYGVIFPTEQPEFLLKSSRDYLGAIVEECFQNNLKFLIYMPMSVFNWNVPGGPYLTVDTQEKLAGVFRRIIPEILERYGREKIAGFWFDLGFTPAFESIPAFVHDVHPEAIVIVNGCLYSPDTADTDYCTTEFMSSRPPVPPYNRPSSIMDRNHDFNEDIPNCASWWWHESRAVYTTIDKKEAPYLADKSFLLKQIICSLGQRGLWNCTFGIPVLPDGTIEDKYEPMFEQVRKFLSWGAETIYDTHGGILSPITPGWFIGGGFCSVTVPNQNENICYVLVTEAPINAFQGIATNGYEPVRITDLRTKTTIDFTFEGGSSIVFHSMDWNDIAEHGVKILKVEF